MSHFKVNYAWVWSGGHVADTCDAKSVCFHEIISWKQDKSLVGHMEEYVGKQEK